MTGGGALVGAPFTIGSVLEDQRHPTIAWDSQRNDYFIAWEDYGDRNVTGADIYGRRLEPDGTMNQGQLALSDAPGDQSWPDVAYDPIAQQYLVVWQDGRDSTTSASDIYGQRVLAGQTTLNLAAQGNVLVCNVPYEQTYPAVAYNGAGHQFLVTWNDQRDGGWWHLYGQRVWWPGLLHCGLQFG